ERDRVANERNLSAGGAHVDVARDIRRYRQCGTVCAARRELDEEILARSDRATERLLVGPTRTRRGGVLQRPAGEIEGNTGRVVELDVIVGKRGAGISTTTVELTDDEMVHRRRWLLHSQTDRTAASASLCVADREGKRLRTRRCERRNR